MVGFKVLTRTETLLLVIGILLSLDESAAKRYRIPKGVVRYKEIRKTLYDGLETAEFQELCRDGTDPQLTNPFCAGWNQNELDALRVAQERTKDFQRALGRYYGFSIQTTLVLSVLLMGSWLIVRRHFIIRGYFNRRFRKPTSGHTFFVYTNMEWELMETRTIVQSEEEYKDDSHVIDDDADAPSGGWPKGYIPFHEQPFPRVMETTRRCIKFEDNLMRYQNNDRF